ncbi:MAG: cation:proton antiporter [Acidobacteria bacterium]|nr:cation:proton antiporter [Acidobacteriota bacterium]
MHSYDLIFTLAGGLSAALVLGYITQRLGLSPLVGYLLAGTIVGPHTPGFVADASLAEQLAEIGVILLMFGVGLQFHIEELLAVRRVAIPGAVAQSAVATALGMWLAMSIGWSAPAGFIFGLALAVASTVVLVRVLSDNNDLHTQAGHIAIGWLVIEDLFTVIALVMIPAVLGSAQGGQSMWTALGITALKVTALVGFTAFVGTRVIPWVLDRIAATRSRELFTLAVLAIALGIAVGSAAVFSVSMALGAFLAGMVVGRSDYSLRAASEALPMRDAFAVLFFVSVGMLLNPIQLVSSPALTLGALAIVLIGKPFDALLIVRLMRYPLKTALTVAVALGQIGEFSFILSSLGRDLGILSPEATNALVATSIASIILNPLLYRLIDPTCVWVAARPRWRALLDPSSAGSVDATDGGHVAAHADPKRHAVIVGYGPTGRTVVQLLTENRIEPTVIELNVDTVRALRAAGTAAVYGDATRVDTLQAAGVPRANVLILGSAGMANSTEVIRMARELNPDIRVLARVPYLRDVQPLKDAGADTVYSGEGEVALAFIEDILGRLGATPEQIDRQRARAHEQLFTPATTASASTD